MFDIYYGIKNDKIFSKNLFYFSSHKLQKHFIFLWLMYAKMVTIEITKKFTGFLTKFWIIWIFGKTQIKYFLIDQFRYIKIQSQTMDFRARLWGINPTNSVFIPQSLVLRSIVWGWILMYRNWPIFMINYFIEFNSPGIKIGVWINSAGLN